MTTFHSDPSTPPRSAPPRVPTTVDQVVEAIVKSASEGRFSPGKRVIEAEVARELGVSRVPVREALRLLESQGIVVNAPYRGMRLMTVDREHLREILIVRSSLEQLAVPAVSNTLRRDPAARQSLNIHISAMARAARRSNVFEMAEADIAFHRSLCLMSENKVLVQLWDMLARRLTIIFGIAIRAMDLTRIHADHVVLVAILLRGDVHEIEGVLDLHIMESLRVIPLPEDRDPD